MSNPLHQINLQFRTAEPFSAQAAQKMEANIATVLIGAAAEAGVAVVLDGGPVHVTRHVHDARSTNACVDCIELAQDGRA